MNFLKNKQLRLRAMAVMAALFGSTRRRKNGRPRYPRHGSHGGCNRSVSSDGGR